MKSRGARLLLAALALAALSACAPKFDPPPDYRGGFLWNSDKSRTITVEAGDTIYSIARRYDSPSRAIIARNGLTPPYTLTVGQTLILDPARVHQVVKGDTLSQLARTYNVEMRLIAEANELGPPYIIRIGQDLWIPDPFTIAAAPTAKQVAGARPPAVVERPTSPKSAIRSEALPPPPGADLQSSAAVAPPVPAPETGTPALVPAPATPPAVPASAPEAPLPAAEPEVEVALVPTPLKEPEARASARFMWPVNGKVVAGFGPAGKGLHNDGINIAAAAGTQVRAADNGVVAYAGNELKGFGNLLLIKHADGWTTAYAHNQKLLVARGDVVMQGQVIATVGRTGNVEAPQLHFEVRKGTQAMNPMDHLAKTGG